MTSRWASARIEVTASTIPCQACPSRAAASQMIWAASSTSQPKPARAVQYQIALVLTRYLGGRSSAAAPLRSAAPPASESGNAFPNAVDCSPLSTLAPRRQSACPAVAGERGDHPEGDEGGADHVALAAEQPDVAAQPRPQTPGDQRVGPVGAQAEQHEHHPEGGHLERHRAAGGVDELRQEGEEEQRQLGVQHVDQHALVEQARGAAWRGGGGDRPRLVVPEQLADPEVDQGRGAEGL